jgi:hypothetical protein
VFLVVLIDYHIFLAMINSCKFFLAILIHSLLVFLALLIIRSDVVSIEEYVVQWSLRDRLFSDYFSSFIYAGITDVTLVGLSCRKLIIYVYRAVRFYFFVLNVISLAVI